MSWATRKKSIYLGLIVLVLIVVIGLPAFFTFYHPASCTDGKQNGDEQGIDCGGTCPKLCDFQIPKPIVVWVRPAEVVPGVYNVLAYVDNPNITLGSDKVGYSFKLYDSEGSLVAEKKGATAIPSRKSFAIFEGGINTGNKKVQRAIFEFNTAFAWHSVVSLDQSVSIQNKNLDVSGKNPKLTATLVNQSSDSFPQIEAVAIIFDVDGNAIAFSRTIIDKLDKHEAYPLIFTWPQVFQASTSRVEIITRLVF